MHWKHKHVFSKLYLLVWTSDKQETILITYTFVHSESRQLTFNEGINSEKLRHILQHFAFTYLPSLLHDFHSAFSAIDFFSVITTDMLPSFLVSWWVALRPPCSPFHMLLFCDPCHQGQAWFYTEITIALWEHWPQKAITNLLVWSNISASACVHFPELIPENCTNMLSLWEAYFILLRVLFYQSRIRSLSLIRRLLTTRHGCNRRLALAFRKHAAAGLVHSLSHFVSHILVSAQEAARLLFVL